MRAHAIALIVASLCFATACGTADARQQTTTIVHLTSGDEQRTYRVVLPSPRPRDAPLVLALHGLYGSGRRFERTSGWDAVVRSAAAAVVYPDSYEQGWRSEAGAEQDVAFLARVIRDVVRRYDLDSRRVYVTGHSSGAFMTYRLTCEHPELIAAIGPVAGSPVTDCEREIDPKPVIAVHGTADTTVPYDGGVPNVPGRPTANEIPSAHEVIARWVNRDGCDGTPSSRTAAGVQREVWRGCDHGTQVRLVSLVGWPHSYATRAAGAPIDATTELWSFLRRFQRR